MHDEEEKKDDKKEEKKGGEMPEWAQKLQQSIEKITETLNSRQDEPEKVQKIEVPKPPQPVPEPENEPEEVPEQIQEQEKKPEKKKTFLEWLF